MEYFRIFKKELLIWFILHMIYVFFYMVICSLTDRIIADLAVMSYMTVVLWLLYCICVMVDPMVESLNKKKDNFEKDNLIFFCTDCDTEILPNNVSVTQTLKPKGNFLSWIKNKLGKKYKRKYCFQCGQLLIDKMFKDFECNGGQIKISKKKSFK